MRPSFFTSIWTSSPSRTVSTRRRIQLAEPIQALTDQHPMHRRRVHLHDPADSGRSQLVFASHPFDPTFHTPRCAPRTSVRPARPVPQPSVALSPPASPPLIRRRPRDPHLGGDMRDRPAAADPLDQFLATMNRQPSVSVHEGLLEWRACLATCTPTPGGPLHTRTLSTTSMVITASACYGAGTPPGATV